MAKYPEDGFFQGKCLFCGNDAGEEFFSGSRESYDVCDCEKRKLAQLAKCNYEAAWKVAHDRYDEILRQEQMKVLQGTLNSLVRQSNEYLLKNRSGSNGSGNS